MKGRIIVLALALLALPASGAWATVYNFSNTVDFGGTGTDAGRTYVAVSDPNSPPDSIYTFTYFHNITFSPPATSVLSATLTLSHMGNSNNNGEFWIVGGGTSTYLGDLAKSNSAWVDQSFTLPSGLYNTVFGGTWSLQIRLTENTTGQDKIWLDKSVLYGTYEGAAPVPEPGTVTLVGLGLGAPALRRRVRG